MHPHEVIYLEHDGKVLLVDANGIGPQRPGQTNSDESAEKLRFPTSSEVKEMKIEWEEKIRITITKEPSHVTVIKGYPKIPFPHDWAWKDDVFLRDDVEGIVREAVYRSIHRLVSKLIVYNSKDEILMAKVKRGHFRGYWTLPGGYMDHNEHPIEGCQRETLEEIGLNITTDGRPPFVTQKIFNQEGVSFVSFTYSAFWDGEISELSPLEEEIEEIDWFSLQTALKTSVSFFDSEAIRLFLDANK